MSNVTVPGTQKALDKCYYYHIHHHYPQAPAKVPEASLSQNARQRSIVPLPAPERL